MLVHQRVNILKVMIFHGYVQEPKGTFIIWLVVWEHEWMIFPIILGISSSHVTFIFFRGVGQPPTSYYRTPQ